MVGLIDGKKVRSRSQIVCERLCANKGKPSSQAGLGT